MNYTQIHTFWKYTDYDEYNFLPVKGYRMDHLPFVIAQDKGAEGKYLNISVHFHV